MLFLYRLTIYVMWILQIGSCEKVSPDGATFIFIEIGIFY